MKHFITIVPQQKKEDLREVHYKNVEKISDLDVDFKTAFPILIPLKNMCQSGEEIRVTCIITNDVDGKCKANFDTFKEKLSVIAKEKGVSYSVQSIDLPFDESREKQINMFRDIIESFKKDDEIIADITYGNKPSPMVLLMAINFAYQFLDNTIIDKVIYGARNFGPSGGEYIYDVSSLCYLNSIITNMSGANIANPVEFIKQITGSNKEDSDET